MKLPPLVSRPRVLSRPRCPQPPRPQAHLPHRVNRPLHNPERRCFSTLRSVGRLRLSGQLDRLSTGRREVHPVSWTQKMRDSAQESDP